MHFSEPDFWRAGAISTIAIMSIVLVMLTIDSLAAISPGGSHVPPYTVINQHIDYKFDAKRGIDAPVIGGAEPLFGNPWTPLRRRLMIAARWSYNREPVSTATHFSATALITAPISPRRGSILHGKLGRRSPAARRGKRPWSNSSWTRKPIARGRARCRN